MKDQHICTEECTKIYPISLDWNGNGDLYIEQKVGHQELSSDHVRVIVREEDLTFLLDQLHRHWEQRLWKRLEEYLGEHRSNS